MNVLHRAFFAFANWRIKSETDDVPLVGIARLAAESELLEAKGAVEYFEIPTRSLLNRTKPNMPFPGDYQSVPRLQILLSAVCARVHGA